MALFDGVRFFLSSSLSDDRSGELKFVLLNDGAKEAKSIVAATHVITDTNKFEGCQDVPEGAVVVTDLWVEQSIIHERRQSPAHYSADPAMIFSGVVACSTELPETDVEVLAAGITALGGQWRTALTRDVTHLFCVSNTSPKYATAMHFKSTTRVSVLLPHWFDDSVRLGVRGLPVGPYEWPNPPFLLGPEGLAAYWKKSKESGGSPGKSDAAKELLLRLSQITDGVLFPKTVPGLYVAEPSNIWLGRKVLLSPSLSLSPSRRSAVEAGIIRCGGRIVPYSTNNGEGSAVEELENAGKCDVFVTRYRSGKAYVKAVRENKTIGTLGWVFYVHSTGVISRPMDQLLHYPTPKKLIEGFSNHEITVTNYTGEAREYLKKLIDIMGAKFTPNMTGKNTVLIAAYLSGTKTEKAATWSIPIVNHTWLEDCFVRWQNLTVGLEKYIAFPAGMDFSKLLGERGVGGGFTMARFMSGRAGSDGSDIQGWIGLESEEELLALEREDEMSKMAVTMDDDDDERSEGGEVDRPLVIGRGTTVDPSSRLQTLPSASPATQASMDAREVEAAITFVQDEDPEIGTANLSASVPKAQEKASLRETHNAKATGDDASDGDMEIGEVQTIDSPAKKNNGNTPKSRGKKMVATAVEVIKFGFPRASAKKVDECYQEDEKDETTAKQPQKGDRGKPRQTSGSRSRNGGEEEGAPKQSQRGTSRLQRNAGDMTRSRSAVVSEDEGRRKKNTEHEEEEEGTRPTRRSSRSPSKPILRPAAAKANNGRAKIIDTTNVDDEDDDDDTTKDKKWRAASESKVSIGSKGKEKEKTSGIKPTSVREEEENEETETEGDDDELPEVVSAKAKTRASSHQGRKDKASVQSNAKGKKVAEEEEEEESDEAQNENASPSRNRANKYASPGKGIKAIDPPNSDEEELSTTRKRKPSGIKLYRDSSPLSPPPTSSPNVSARTSKRSAAVRASQRLRDEIMPDMNSYQSGLRKGRISLSAAEERLLTASERSRSAGASLKRKAEKKDEKEDIEDAEREVKKKRKVSFDKSAIHPSRIEVDTSKDSSNGTPTPAQHTIKLLTTMIALSDNVSKALAKLGVKFTTNVMECTHMIAPRIVRTEKFICALSLGRTIVSIEWANQSAAVKRLLPENEYPLRDDTGEEKFGFQLKDALENAKARKLFADKVFYVTPRIGGDMQLLKNVITCCGGQFSTTTPTLRILNASLNRHVVSCSEDVSIWRPLSHQHAIYNKELVLTGAFKQLAEWDNKAFRVPGSY